MSSFKTPTCRDNFVCRERTNHDTNRRHKSIKKLKPTCASEKQRALLRISAQAFQRWTNQFSFSFGGVLFKCRRWSRLLASTTPLQLGGQKLVFFVKSPQLLLLWATTKKKKKNATIKTAQGQHRCITFEAPAKFRSLCGVCHNCLPFDTSCDSSAVPR